MSTKGILTSIARGVAYGDVSNMAIRNILSEITKKLYGNFTEQEMYDTMDDLGWRCPYTGIDLSYIKTTKNLSKCATDHIYPQNKEWCGLNVKGNLVIVDRKANQAKGSMSIDDFLLNDTKFLTDYDAIGRTRQQRLDLIKNLQKKYKYDPNKIKNIVSPLLKLRYEEVRKQQEQAIADCLGELSKNGIAPLKPVAAANVAGKSMPKTYKPDLIFNPKDEVLFVKQLMASKKAHFVLTYNTGAVKISSWDASSFTASSNLRGNVQSRPFWRTKAKDGLIKVEVIVD